jgi:hypothetical protein
MMASSVNAFQLESLDLEVVPGGCAIEVGGPPCGVVAVIVVIALIINPELIP